MRLLPIVLTAVLAGCSPTAASKPASSAQASSPSSASAAADPRTAFQVAYREASEHKDVQQMLKLYCWDGVDQEMRKTVQENIQDELSQPIADMEFVSVEPGKYGPRDEGGIRWKPNLNVDVVLKVRYTKPPSGTGLSLSEAKHTLGLQNGQYRITVPIRDK